MRKNHINKLLENMKKAQQENIKVKKESNQNLNIKIGKGNINKKIYYPYLSLH